MGPDQIQNGRSTGSEKDGPGSSLQVLHYLTTSQIGGTEISILNLCRAMRDETAGVIFRQDGPILEQFEKAGI